MASIKLSRSSNLHSVKVFTSERSVGVYDQSMQVRIISNFVLDLIEMDSYKVTLLVLIAAALNFTVMAQRSPYAGSRPSGYKDRFRPKPEEIPIDIINRFGGIDPLATQRPPGPFVNVVLGEPLFLDNRISLDEGSAPTPAPPSNTETSTSRLPFDAYGDAALVNYLLSLPEDRRPFWLINYQAIEAHRNTPSNGGNINTIASRPSFLGK